MLSALIVYSGDGKPSEGFYKLDKSLGKLEEGENKENFGRLNVIGCITIGKNR